MYNTPHSLHSAVGTLKNIGKEMCFISCFVELQITSSAATDLNIKGDGKAIIRGNEGVNIMGRTVEFKMGGDIELRAVSQEFDLSCK